MVEEIKVVEDMVNVRVNRMVHDVVEMVLHRLIDHVVVMVLHRFVHHISALTLIRAVIHIVDCRPVMHIWETVDVRWIGSIFILNQSALRMTLSIIECVKSEGVPPPMGIPQGIVVITHQKRYRFVNG